MADVSKLKLGSTTYDIKAKSGTATTAFYGVCTTAAATAAKEVIIVDPTVTRTDLLAAGTILHVKFSNANGVANPTLTCFNNSGTVAAPTKGSTTLMAAKSIKRYGTTAPSTSAASSWRAGAIVALVYDGTNWIEVTAVDDNTTYSNMSLGSAFCTSTTAAGTVAKVATPVNGTCSLVTNGIVSVRFTYGNTAASPTLNVSGKGAKPIWYRGAVLTADNASEIWNAGDTVTFYYDNTRYNIIAVERDDLMTQTIDNLNIFKDAKSIGFGDSNMKGTYFDADYESTRHQCIYGQICDILGCEYDNRGIDGAHYDTDPDNMDLVRSAHAIMEQIDAANADPDVKLVVFVGGINDFHYSLTIDYTHFINSVKACVSAAIDKFPNAVFILIWDQGRQDANQIMLRYARGIRTVAMDLSMEYNKRIVAPFTADFFMGYSTLYYNQNHFNPDGTYVLAKRAIRALFGLNDSPMTRRTVVDPNTGFSNCLAIVHTVINPETFVRTDDVEIYFHSSFTYSGGDVIQNGTAIFDLPFGFDANVAATPYTIDNEMGTKHLHHFDCIMCLQGNNPNNTFSATGVPIELYQTYPNQQSVTDSPKVQFRVLYNTPVSNFSSHRSSFTYHNMMIPRND